MLRRIRALARCPQITPGIEPSGTNTEQIRDATASAETRPRADCRPAAAAVDVDAGCEAVCGMGAGGGGAPAAATSARVSGRNGYGFLAGGTGNLNAAVSRVTQNFLAAPRAKEFEFAHQTFLFCASCLMPDYKRVKSMQHQTERVPANVPGEMPVVGEAPRAFQTSSHSEIQRPLPRPTNNCIYRAEILMRADSRRLTWRAGLLA